MQKNKGAYILFLEGKIKAEDFYRYLKSTGESGFLEFISQYYKPEYFQRIESFLKGRYECIKFSFPVVGDDVSFINYGLIVFTKDKISVVSNSMDDSINQRIKDISKDKPLFVIFQDNTFKGFSFSGAFYTAATLRKDIDKVLISFEIGKELDIHQVSRLDKKTEIAINNKIPFITAGDFKTAEDAVLLTDKILSMIKQTTNIESFKVDPEKKYIIFGYNIKELRQIALSILKYLHSISKPAVILNAAADGILTKYKILDLTGREKDTPQNLDNYFAVITDDIEIATKLEQHTVIQNLKESHSLYQIVDSYIRDTIKEEKIDPSLITKLIKFSVFYGDGIPVEKFDCIKEVPSFMYEDRLVYKFRNKKFGEYFTARYFVEFAKKEERTQLLSTVNHRFVIFHPEIKNIEKQTIKQLLEALYNSAQFRNLYAKEYEKFIQLSKDYKLEKIVAYEQAKKFYIEAKYKKSIEYLSKLKDKKSKILKVNILVDLWALEEALNLLKNLSIEPYKKYGILIYIYLKKGDIGKAIYYLNKKLKHPQDRQKESYHILVLAYRYRLNPTEENKKELLDNFEKYLKEFEIGFKSGDYNEYDIYYLIRNFSYSLLNHHVYTDPKYQFNINHIDKIQPLYPTLINIAYINKDLSTLEKLSKKLYFKKQPVENIAALAARAILTDKQAHKQDLLDRYTELKDNFNNLLKPFKTSTQLNYSLDNLHTFFKSLVYVQ